MSGSTIPLSMAPLLSTSVVKQRMCIINNNQVYVKNSLFVPLLHYCDVVTG